MRTINSKSALVYAKPKKKISVAVSSACPGSGQIVLKKDAWNIRNKRASWGYDEGWRATCPHCSKVCSVGPASKAIQKHQPMKPKPVRLTKAEKLAQKQEKLDQLYHRTYDKGKEGVGGLRPDTFSPPLQGLDEREVWIMAYMDGLADGGHNMKLGAFKRWLAQN